MTNEERYELTDYIGEVIIKDARDSVLEDNIKIVRYQTRNPKDLEHYKALSTLSQEQREAVCDLLSSVITETIYEFLETIEDHPDRMELVIIKDGKRYNMADVSWKMGSEIACYGEEGWIQKFSKIGRFVM